MAIAAAVVVVTGSVAITLAPEADARVQQWNRNDLAQIATATGGLFAVAANVGVQLGNIRVTCQ